MRIYHEPPYGGVVLDAAADANRAAVRAVTTDAVNLVGLAFYGRGTPVEKTLRGLELHP